ncbi:MAG: hypothetical protein SOX97_00910 [Sutterella sp.]|nr:hypothetical protein [Sutterella sp.]
MRCADIDACRFGDKLDDIFAKAVHLRRKEPAGAEDDKAKCEIENENRFEKPVQPEGTAGRAIAVIFIGDGTASEKVFHRNEGRKKVRGRLAQV